MTHPSLPTGPALERLLEEVECAMYEDLYAAAPSDVRVAHGLAAERRGTALRLTVERVNHPFFNRVMGVGLDEGASAAWVASQARHYRHRGISRYMVQVLPHVGTPAVERAFAEAGWVRLRGWVKHVGTADASLEAASDLRVAPVADRHADWAAICAEGFGVPASLLPWLEALCRRERWHAYLACEGDEPVAAGAFFRHGAFATLTFAATRPVARRRGAQSALIARRVRDAAAAGCAWILAETDEPPPGETNPSTRNVVRLGLPARFTRANWGPPKPAAPA